MLKARVPNVEMHIYGNGVHGNGLKARDGAPFGTWQDRFIDWFRDLGFLGKAGRRNEGDAGCRSARGRPHQYEAGLTRVGAYVPAAPWPGLRARVESQYPRLPMIGNRGTA